MVFGLNKKERRVPDLSRYDYYYRNKQDESTPQDYIDRYNGNKTGLGAGRTMSMVNESTSRPVPVQRVRKSSEYTTSKSPKKYLQVNNADTAGRTYSLRSQNSVNSLRNGGRVNSLTSNKGKWNQRPKPQGSSVGEHSSNNSRSNSLTARSTKGRDGSGRTRSITRRTIKRVDGVDYVETTTTTTTQLAKSPKGFPGYRKEIDHEFNQFSGNFVDDGAFSEITEAENESETTNEHLNDYSNTAVPGSFSPVDRNHRGIVPLDDASSISKFSDAPESPTFSSTDLESTRKNFSKQHSAKTQNVGKLVKEKKTARSSHLASPKRSEVPQPKVQSRKVPTEEEMYAKALEIAKKKVQQMHVTHEGPISNDESSLSRNTAPINDVDSNLSHMSPQRSDTQIRHTLRGSMDPARSQNKKSTGLAKANAGPERKDVTTPTTKGLSDEEMYAKALATAQKKYNDSHFLTDSIQVNVPRNSATGSSDLPVLEVPKNIKKISNISAETDNENLKPMTYHTEMNSSLRSPEAVKEPSSKISMLRKISSVGSTSKAPQPEELVSTTAAATTAAAAPESAKKSRFKNVFDRVIQFSQENNGPQPVKKDLSKQEPEHVPTAHAKSSLENHQTQSVPQINVTHENEAIALDPIDDIQEMTQNDVSPAVIEDTEPLSTLDPLQHENPELNHDSMANTVAATKNTTRSTKETESVKTNPISDVQENIKTVKTETTQKINTQPRPAETPLNTSSSPKSQPASTDKKSPKKLKFLNKLFKKK